MADLPFRLAFDTVSHATSGAILKRPSQLLNRVTACTTWISSACAYFISPSELRSIAHASSLLGAPDGSQSWETNPKA